MATVQSLAWFSDCSVPFVFRLFLVRHADGRKVQRNRVVFNFAKCSFEWVVVAVVIIFYRVFKNPDTLCFHCV